MIPRIEQPFRWNALVRRVGEDRPASKLAAGLNRRKLPVKARPIGARYADDPTLIDLTLEISAPQQGESIPSPQSGLGFAGFTPQQRYLLLDWLQDPRQPAPAAFQQLYLAHLEVRLLEKAQLATKAHDELLYLQTAQDWESSLPLARAILLGFWLVQDGDGLVQWSEAGSVPAALLGVALGCQALMQTRLRAGQLPSILAAWGLGSEALSVDALALRLDSLERNLGAPLLEHALAQLSETANEYQPWRCAHRDLRLSLPQPDLRLLLEPLLAEMLEVVDVVVGALPGRAAANATQSEVSDLEALGWRLILEFGHSRSEFYPFALELLQRLPTYTQLMDENRTLVNRAIFREADMRRFWRIWDYVQNWSTTRVYVNGNELEQWQVWPYSQYLR